MPHAVSLISTLAAGFGLALILGFIAARLKLPALVGYVLAGIVIGPATPGFVADAAIAAQLAEIGVMLLMFGVGLHFSIDDLMAVRKIAVPGAIVQMVVATALGMGVATLWGWSPGAALVFGLTLSVASTVVLLKALESLGLVDSANGRIAVGWLVVEDLAMVMVLVLLTAIAPSLGGKAADSVSTHGVVVELLIQLAEVAGFIALMLVVGRKLFPWILWHVVRTGSRELFTLCVVAAAVSIAYGAAYLFEVSFALGAFFAGMVLRESEFSHRAAEQTLPLQDAFSVLFFVAVGMLLDPLILVKQPAMVAATVAIIVFGKALAALALVLAFRYPLRTALTVAASLAQIGEFSFILAELGITLGLLPKEGGSLIIAGALLSIAINPLLFGAVDPIASWWERRSSKADRPLPPANPLASLPTQTDTRLLTGHVVLVGWGRVGKRIAAALAERGTPFVVAEQNRDLVERLRNDSVLAVWGNATDPEVLVKAHVSDAHALVIATPETVQVRAMVQTARALNPGIHVVVRSHNAEEAQLLEADGTGSVFVGESELAKAMVRHLGEVIDLEKRGAKDPA